MNHKKEQIRKLNFNDYEAFKNVLYVFREAPWFENLTNQDVLDEWKLYQKSDIEKALENRIGFSSNDNYSVFGYFVDDELVSIVTYTLSYGDDVMHKEHGVMFDKDEIVAYIYGMATLSSARGKGYNTHLLKAAKEYFNYVGIDKSYARYAVSREEIDFVNHKYEDIVAGLSTYKSKSQSIHILKKAGYIEYFDKPNQLHIQNCTNAGYKFDTVTEDLRAFCILDCQKELVMEPVEVAAKSKKLVLPIYN